MSFEIVFPRGGCLLGASPDAIGSPLGSKEGLFGLVVMIRLRSVSVGI